MGEEDEISFYLQPGFDNVRGDRLLVVRLAVGPDIVWDMVPNPVAPRSSITQGALDDLMR